MIIFSSTCLRKTASGGAGVLPARILCEIVATSLSSSCSRIISSSTTAAILPSTSACAGK